MLIKATHFDEDITMKKQILLVTTLSAALMFSGTALAVDQVRSQDRDQVQDQVYGSQLMTRQERAQYRAKMRAAKSAQEREQIRKEHHKRMQARAKERGVTLPDEPPARDSGKGQGNGMGLQGKGVRQGGGGR